MTGRVDIGATYRVGRGGVRITWRDGSTTSHSAGVRITFNVMMPLKIEGRLIPVSPRGIAGYEAPALKPDTKAVPARRSDPRMANYIYEAPHG